MVTKELQAPPLHTPQNGIGSEQILHPEIPQVQDGPPFPVFQGLQLALHHLLERGLPISLDRLNEERHFDKKNGVPNYTRKNRWYTNSTLNFMGTKYYKSGWVLTVVNEAIDPKNQKMKKRSFLLITQEAYEAKNRLRQDSGNGVKGLIIGNSSEITKIQQERSQSNPSPARVGDQIPGESSSDSRPGKRGSQQNTRLSKLYPHPPSDANNPFVVVSESPLPNNPPPEEEAEWKKEEIRRARHALKIAISRTAIENFQASNYIFRQQISDLLKAASSYNNFESIVGAISEIKEFTINALNQTIQRWWNTEKIEDLEPIERPPARRVLELKNTQRLNAQEILKIILNKL